MRHLFVFIGFFICHCACTQSTNWAGNWGGTLKFEGQTLHIIFHVQVKYSGWYTKLEVIEQNLKNYTVSSTEVEKSGIRFTMDAFEARYTGKRIDSNTIHGTFTQSGKSQQLKLKRIWGEWPKPKKQTPKPPFKYVSEEVRISVANGRIMVAGTLTKPDSFGTYPVIILISGSGPQDRNGSIGLHHPFLILADTFTKLGFAVLRCDDRGAGLTRGHPETLAKTTSLDFAKDVGYFIEFLKHRKDIDTNKIGLLGHSEGGIVAPMVASARKDVDFIILLAGPAGGGKSINIFQNRNFYAKVGLKKRHLRSAMKLHLSLLDAVIDSPDTLVYKQKFDSIIHYWSKHQATFKTKRMLYGRNGKNSKRTYASYKSLMTPWLKYFITYNPVPDILNVKCPILALNGDKDLQVPTDPHLTTLSEILQKSGNTSSKAMELKGLNHLFQTCKTCELNEYNSLEESFSPVAIGIICDWLMKEVLK